MLLEQALVPVDRHSSAGIDWPSGPLLLELHLSDHPVLHMLPALVLRIQAVAALAEGTLGLEPACRPYRV
jgi:hypothetical protein